MADTDKELKAILTTKTSKNGKVYKCVLIQLTADCEKQVFLDPAEEALLRREFEVSKPVAPFVEYGSNV